jgi:hypothetical protein
LLFNMILCLLRILEFVHSRIKYDLGACNSWIWRVRSLSHCYRLIVVSFDYSYIRSIFSALLRKNLARVNTFCFSLFFSLACILLLFLLFVIFLSSLSNFSEFHNFLFLCNSVLLIHFLHTFLPFLSIYAMFFVKSFSSLSRELLNLSFSEIILCISNEHKDWDERKGNT